MDTLWTAAGEWWVQATLSGGAVLLLGWLCTLAFRSPGVRQQIGAWAARGAVLAAGLSALPQWVLLPRPDWMPSPEPVVAKADPSPVVKPEPPVTVDEPLSPVVPEQEFFEPEPEPMRWVFIPREQLRLTELPVREEPETVPVPVAASVPTAAESTDSPLSRVVPLLLSVYAVVAGWLFLQLVWERLAVAWLLRDVTPLVGRARWVWDRLAVDEPNRRAVASTRVRTPVCVGFFRPLVVLPKHMADTADEPTLRWVLAHELDHLRRGDTRTAHWVGVARAVFFFVPWFWLLRRDLNLCQEFLADAAATRAGGTPADYAAFLVDLSGGRATRRPIAAARMRAGKSDLFRRVQMLLNGKTLTAGVTRGFTWLAGTAAVAAAVGLSGLGFADEPKKEPKTEKRVIEVKKSKGGDEKKGDVVTPKRVELLDVDAISQGEVLKKVKEEAVQLLKDGKVEEAKKLLEQLGKVDVVKRVPMIERADVVRDVPVVRPVIERVPMRFQPQPDVVRQAPRVITGVDNDLRAQYERQLKEFDESIKKAKDGEAKEQLEKARDEYKKAMEEPLKKADEARKDLDAARKKLEQAERANRVQNDEAVRRLMDMQKDLEKKLFDDLKKFEGFEGFKGLEGLQLQGLGRLEGMNGFMVGPDGMFAPMSRNATQPRLGVRVDKVPTVLAEQLDLGKDTGLVIADVTAGSPAEKAGLKKNDVLLALAGKDVPTDPVTFTEMVGKLKAGEKVDAVVLRKGKKTSVKGIELPEPKKSPRGDFERGGVQVPDGRGGANESVQIQINDDAVTLTATADGVGYTITGSAEKGKLVPGKIVIKEGNESKEYESLDKVPEGQRATVERLMGKVRVFGK